MYQKQTGSVDYDMEQIVLQSAVNKITKLIKNDYVLTLF